MTHPSWDHNSKDTLIQQAIVTNHHRDGGVKMCLEERWFSLGEVCTLTSLVSCR